VCNLAHVTKRGLESHRDQRFRHLVATGTHQLGSAARTSMFPRNPEGTSSALPRRVSGRAHRRRAPGARGADRCPSARANHAQRGTDLRREELAHVRPALTDVEAVLDNNRRSQQSATVEGDSCGAPPCDDGGPTVARTIHACISQCRADVTIDDRPVDFVAGRYDVGARTMIVVRVSEERLGNSQGCVSSMGSLAKPWQICEKTPVYAAS
jgi:hypothetical protein